MSSLQNQEINLFILAIILFPVLSIPLLYVLPKQVNPGWITSAIGLLQIILWSHTLLTVYQETNLHQAWSWFLLPNGLSVQIGIYIDLLSALLLVMVSLISWVSTLYSIAYLPPYAHKKRYFSLYSLSLTSMLWLLVADNLWGMFIGWELLSVTSCLMIGFWYQTSAAVQAGTYTWVINKIGSIFFLIGLLLIVIDVDNCDITQLTNINASWNHHSKSNHCYLAGFCFLIAVLAKSAQFPLFSWLPQSMVAPTPVSALLHTATVLSAGIYLLIRIQPILHFDLHSLLIIIGHLTAFIGSSTALAQRHLKRMLAYSTLSHLGYIVAAIGLGNTYIAVIYLIVHSFAKACLFFIAGVIAYFLQFHGITEKEAYNMSYMGDILCRLPLAAISYLVATWGLGMIPGLIGFTTKENILTHTVAWANDFPGGYLYYINPLLALVSNGLTILYIGKAFVRIFLGKPRWKHVAPSCLPNSTNHQSLWLMQGSMVICSVCILFVSYLLNKYSCPEGAGQTISKVDIKESIKIIAYGSLLLVISWLVISQFKSTTWVRVTSGPTLTPRRTPVHVQGAQTLYKLFLHGWYLDACITFLGSQVVTCSKLAEQVEKWCFHRLINQLTRGYVMTAHIVHWLDRQIISDIAHKIAVLSQQAGQLYLHLQHGRTQWYLVWTCIGMGLLMTIWMVFIA